MFRDRKKGIIHRYFRYRGFGRISGVLKITFGKFQSGKME
jgi:hypothetical protein